ncbi:hypothetical protein YC2023_122683 [Brassica napus]
MFHISETFRNGIFQKLAETHWKLRERNRVVEREGSALAVGSSSSSCYQNFASYKQNLRS